MHTNATTSEDADAFESAFADYSPEARRVLIAAAAAIRQEAAAMPELNGVEVSLKWGQPSYAPQTAAGRPKVGTPIRLGVVKSGAPALFVHCATSLIADWAATAGPDVKVEGRRALILDHDDMAAARAFIRRALTYARR